MVVENQGNTQEASGLTLSFFLFYSLRFQTCNKFLYSSTWIMPFSNSLPSAQQIAQQISGMHIGAESLQEGQARWERGEPDYLGRDSFANIQAYIDTKIKSNGKQTCSWTQSMSCVQNDFKMLCLAWISDVDQGSNCDQQLYMGISVIPILWGRIEDCYFVRQRIDSCFGKCFSRPCPLTCHKSSTEGSKCEHFSIFKCISYSVAYYIIFISVMRCFETLFFSISSSNKEDNIRQEIGAVAS